MQHISSPRAPRSSHHRSTSTTRTSPRQQDRVRPFGGHRINQPNYEEPPQPVLVPGNLHDEDDVFNVDPTAAILDAGGETYQEPIEPAGRRRFVGGFVGLRKALQRNRAPEGGGIAIPEPAVVHAEETQYESVPRGDPEMQHVPGTPYASPQRGVRYAAPSPDVQYAPYTPYGPPGPDGQYHDSPVRERHYRQESSSSTSETVHATTQEHYEGTTIVNHGMVVPGEQYDSPELVEPQLGSDYAKMQSPPRSEASFGSYMTRLHRFFRTINDLPWIAPDRVTVDYIPGKARLDPGAPTPRPRPARRPIISWYNTNQPQISIDLLSGSSSPLTEFSQAQPIAVPVSIATPTARYPDVVYANNMPVPTSAAEPPPMARSGPGSNRPRRIPVPTLSPDIEEGDAYHAPRYPNGGYVPYEQQPMPMAQMYTGTSVASSQRAPRQH
ncbi:hypothetical protein DFH09DRAFT_560900 [Mycena vulgaris]|nr:hypothetical protein DFH09DRAFT_560900 [Mycena vulgaris]